MSGPRGGWRFEIEIAPSLPPLAWIARAAPPAIKVLCGQSVRTDDDGFFEGTWAGSQSLASIADATTVFGSGVVARDDELVVITPSHNLEAVYFLRGTSGVMLSNSLVGLLTAAGTDLDPRVNYPSIFVAGTELRWLVDDPAKRATAGQMTIPTQSTPVISQTFENLLVPANLESRVVRKPREPAFVSFAEYRERMTTALMSLIDNAHPYAPVVSLSSGYDSTGIAAVAASVGCRRSLGFESARATRKNASTGDSGAATAVLLGFHHEIYERLAYLADPNLPEAEFLATGMAGEEIVFRSLEPALARTMLLTGYWGGRQWAMANNDDWHRFGPTDTGGASLTEFRLRANFYHLPLAFFGAAQDSAGPTLLDLEEMGPYRVGGRYDRPIPRRLAEEAGVPRGSFATTKRAATVLLQHDGLPAFSPGSRSSIERFAAAEGSPLEVQRRPRIGRLGRGVIRLAHLVHLNPLVQGLERRRRNLVHHDPVVGTLLLRWAVSVVRDRYRAAEALR